MKEKISNDLIKKEKCEYFKNWRKNNKEKIKRHNERYWQKRVEQKIQKNQK